MALYANISSGAPKSASAQNAINIAGRLRMLSQKLAKEALFVITGANKSSHLERMKNTEELFISRLVALRYGDSYMGIEPFKSEKIIDQLKKLSILWQDYISVTYKIVSHQAPSIKALQKFNSLSNNITKEANHVVTLIENIR